MWCLFDGGRVPAARVRGPLSNQLMLLPAHQFGDDHLDLHFKRLAVSASSCTTFFISFVRFHLSFAIHRPRHPRTAARTHPCSFIHSPQSTKLAPPSEGHCPPPLLCSPAQAQIGIPYNSQLHVLHLWIPCPDALLRSSAATSIEIDTNSSTTVFIIFN